MPQLLCRAPNSLKYKGSLEANRSKSNLPATCSRYAQDNPDQTVLAMPFIFNIGSDIGTNIGNNTVTSGDVEDESCFN